MLHKHAYTNFKRQWVLTNQNFNPNNQTNFKRQWMHIHMYLHPYKPLKKKKKKKNLRLFLFYLTPQNYSLSEFRYGMLIPNQK